ncbi:MAG: DUF1524 domain-containing protein [Streptosporangiales bacterium]|nr:DUF1524 domain-containing protein [Streptosporangiales bacterium]
MTAPKPARRRPALPARRVLTALTAAALLVVSGFAGPAVAEPPAPPDAETALAHLAELTVADPMPEDGYSRDEFPTWSEQGDSCDTREMVLQRDGTDVQVGSDCYPTSGSWFSVYDETTTSEPSEATVDHMVPLKNAWISGAQDWTIDERETFANDLEHAQLIIASQSSNSSKGDSDPSEWKPENTDYWCVYSRSWVDVKYVYDLTVTDAEKGALEEMLATC